MAVADQAVRDPRVDELVAEDLRRLHAADGDRVKRRRRDDEPGQQDDVRQRRDAGGKRAHRPTLARS